MLIAVVGAVSFLVLGVLIGLRMPWGAKQPHRAAGVAMRANSDNDLVLFEAEDRRQLAFGAPTSTRALSSGLSRHGGSPCPLRSPASHHTRPSAG